MPNRLKNKQSTMPMGFTLLEVLVALAIGMVILTGTLSYFSRGLKSLQTDDAYARLHENATKAASLISRDIQLAGFYGFGGSANIANIVDSNGYQDKFTPPYPVGGALVNASAYSNECGGGQAQIKLSSPLEFYPTPDTVPTMNRSNCTINLKLTTPSSTALVLRGALEGNRIDPTSACDTSLNANTLYVTATPFNGVDSPGVAFFYGTPNPCRGDGTDTIYSFPQLYASGLLAERSSGLRYPVFRYQYRVYYVAEDTRPGRTNRTYLARRQLEPGNTAFTSQMSEINVVDGIERVHYVWGIDEVGAVDRTGRVIGDGITDRWSTNLAESEFNNVNAVRIQILAKSTTLEPGHNEEGRSYLFAGETTPYAPTCVIGPTNNDPQNCRYRRLLYQHTTSLRNCNLRRRTDFFGGIAC